MARTESPSEGCLDEFNIFTHIEVMEDEIKKMNFHSNYYSNLVKERSRSKDHNLSKDGILNGRIGTLLPLLQLERCRNLEPILLS